MPQACIEPALVPLLHGNLVTAASRQSSQSACNTERNSISTITFNYQGSDEPARWGLPPKRRRTSSSQPRSTNDASRAHLLRASAELQMRASRLAGLYFAPGGVPAAGMAGRPQPEKKGMSKGDWCVAGS